MTNSTHLWPYVQKPCSVLSHDSSALRGVGAANGWRLCSCLWLGCCLWIYSHHCLWCTNIQWSHQSIASDATFHSFPCVCVVCMCVYMCVRIRILCRVVYIFITYCVCGVCVQAFVYACVVWGVCVWVYRHFISLLAVDNVSRAETSCSPTPTRRLYWSCSIACSLPTWAML